MLSAEIIDAYEVISRRPWYSSLGVSSARYFGVRNGVQLFLFRLRDSRDDGGCLCCRGARACTCDAINELVVRVGHACHCVFPIRVYIQPIKYILR